MSAIILVTGDSSTPVLKCVSLATGTKCLPASQISKCHGLILHDCHAEVLALRGLNRWLLQEMKLLLSNLEYTSDFLVLSDSHSDLTSRNCEQKSNIPPFQLRHQTSIYLFNTTAPCGDASMDLLISSSADATPWSSENLALDLSTGQPLGRGHFSLLGAVRRKPARGDAEATMSKSCSDKIALKQFTGCLTFPVDTLLRNDQDQNIFMKGLVVYNDQYNQTGYGRAFGPTGRLGVIADHKATFFEVHTLPQDFPRFEYERNSDGKSKVTNICAVYVAGSKGIAPVQEVLVNGVKQGYKQFDSRPGKASVLCRRKMLELAMDVHTLLDASGYVIPGFGGKLYSEFKMTESRRRKIFVKSEVVGKLGGWVSNSLEDDFEVASKEIFLK